MKKRLISILLVLAFVISLLPLGGCKDAGGFVSRGEWIAMLASEFGMDSYTENTPFYSDVPATSEYFTYVQSAAEWRVLEVFTGDKIGVDKAVTCEQVAGTAAVAAGFLDDGGTFSADAALTYAKANGIVAGDRKASRKMNQEDCEAAIAAAKKIYLSAPINEKISAAFNPDLLNLGNVEADKIRVDDSQVAFPAGSGSFSQGTAPGQQPTVPGQPDDNTVTPPTQPGTTTGGNAVIREGNGLIVRIETANGTVEVREGDVFTTPPTLEHPFGVARKAVRIREENGQIIVETEEPTLEDLFEELSVHTTVSADFDNAIWADGVGDGGAGFVQAKSDGQGGFTIEFLGARQPAFSVVPMKSNSFSKTYNFGSGKFNASWTNKTPSDLGAGSGAQAFAKSSFKYDGNPSVEDFGGSTDSWTKKLEVSNEFSGSYKITGTISGSIEVTPEVDFSIFSGLKTASVRVGSNLSNTLRIEGKMDEKLKIATIPIPIGATGLSVSVDLVVFVNASGHLEVRAELSSTAKVEYSNKKLKTSSDTSFDTSAEAALDVNFGADLSASLDALGVKIINAGVKAGGELNAEAGINGTVKATTEGSQGRLTYQESMYIKAELYAPIVDIYTGGDTVVGKLGLNKTWHPITKAQAKKWTLVDEDWVFWELEVATENDQVVDSEETTAGDEAGIGSSDETRLRLSAYVVTLGNESRQLTLDVYDGETAPAVTWTSNDPSVATVDAGGVVTPVSEGSTFITVQLQSDPGVYANCAVFVGSGESVGNDWEFLDPNLPTV